MARERRAKRSPPGRPAGSATNEGKPPMGDLDTILTWLVILASAVALYQVCRIAPAENLGWVVVLLFLLAAAGAGHFLLPGYGGQVALALWLVLFLAPMLVQRFAVNAVLRKHHR